MDCYLFVELELFERELKLVAIVALVIACKYEEEWFLFALDLYNTHTPFGL